MRTSKLNEALLRQIGENGPITIRELDALSDLADLLPVSGSKPSVNSLEAQRLVDAEKIQNRGTLYTLSSKGRRTLAALAVLAPGAAAAPRQSPMEGPCYDGRDLRPFIGRGPGAMRAFELPSLDNGVQVERSRPVSLGRPPEKRG